MTDTPYNSINQFSGGVRSCNEQRAKRQHEYGKSFIDAILRRAIPINSRMNELQPKKGFQRASAEAVRQALGKRACQL